MLNSVSVVFFLCTFNASKVTFIHFLFQWQIACSFYRKTISTNIKMLDGLVFQKPNPNRILVFRTSLENALAMKSWTLRQGANVTIIIIIIIYHIVIYYYYYYCHSADSDKFLCIIVGHQVETESLPATNKTHVHN